LISRSQEDHTYQTSSFAVHNSAPGSLIAYCLGITDIDPIQYDLLFERFLNPERVSMPDIDIDFCVHGRAEVINHVSQLYGRESVCQIITFGTMASKAAIKDVGRALDMPYADVEKIAKMIPPPVRGRNISITQAIESVPELKGAMETDAQTKKVIEIARRWKAAPATRRCMRRASSSRRNRSKNWCRSRSITSRNSRPSLKCPTSKRRACSRWIFWG
jgi:hypothetical protein